MPLHLTSIVLLVFCLLSACDLNKGQSFPEIYDEYKEENKDNVIVDDGIVDGGGIDGSQETPIDETSGGTGNGGSDGNNGGGGNTQTPEPQLSAYFQNDYLPRGVVASENYIDASTLFVDQTIPSNACQNYNLQTRSCEGGSYQAYKSLSGLPATLTEGSVVIVRDGLYHESLRIEAVGVSSAPIIFSVYNNETVVLQPPTDVPPIEIVNSKQIAIDGFFMDNTYGWFYIENSEHIVIKNNVLKNSRSDGVVVLGSKFVSIVNNELENTAGYNIAFFNSSSSVIKDNIVQESNTLNGLPAHVPEYASFESLWVLKCSSYNYVQNNYFRNGKEKIGEIIDCENDGPNSNITLTDSSKHNVVEKNIFAFVGEVVDRSPFAAVELGGQYNIVRFNEFYRNLGPSIQVSVYAGRASHVVGNRIYNNTMHRGDFAGISTSHSNNYTIDDNRFENNIISSHVFAVHDNRWNWYTDVLQGNPVAIRMRDVNINSIFSNNLLHSALQDADGSLDRYFLAIGNRNDQQATTLPRPMLTLEQWQQQYPSIFQNFLISDPMYISEQTNDFRLQENSAAIDFGKFLGRTASAGAGSMISLDDVSYFADGFGIAGIKGDLLKLAGSGDVARVIAVDYINNTLLMDKELSWTNGEEITLNYEGAGPDVGRFEWEPAN